ncbi:MAG: tRNA 2-thiouridine(34) synthase MnmA [Acidimicrobiales bacterium]|nr:tRNA 2-thiouridine(34) synthase MnmA [Acidimicrobiales bacterium]
MSTRRLRVLCALSGGVDSSVAAALLLEQGHDVSGVTMKLWGGESDSGCCSVSDVDDARRVAQQLDIDFHVFNFGEDFERHVVDPYVTAHASGRTPNPCIECNRHLKFDRLYRRAAALGFDAVATGHHARIVTRPDGVRRVRRAVDVAKDQSYVLSMLDQVALARTILPIGDHTKDEVRAHAERLGLRTAAKRDSQDVCFITSAGGRSEFLGRRIPLTPGRMIDEEGRELGTVPAVQLVTIGQRKGLGLEGGPAPRYVVDVDVERRAVVIGDERSLYVSSVRCVGATWSAEPVTGEVLAQPSAHGAALPAILELVDPGTQRLGAGGVDGWPAQGSLVGDGIVDVHWVEPHRRVAPGQTVAFYQGDEVVGAAIAT